MKKRNIFASITALVMACTSFGGFTAYAEDAVVETDPLAGLSADFQNWSLNDEGGIVSPEGEAWYKILSRGGGNSSTIVTEADGNKYLQFNYTTADGQDYTLRKDNLAITGSIVLSVKFRSTNPGGSRNFVLPIWGPEDRVVPLHIQNDQNDKNIGKIKANNGGIATTISTVDANVWYDFKVILHYDETAKKYTTYDVYMNGILKADGFAMPKQLSKITNIGLLLSTAYGLGDTELDDFSVIPYAPEHSRFKLYQDFESFEEGELLAKTLKIPTGYYIGNAGVHDIVIEKEASGNKIIRLDDKAGSGNTVQVAVGNASYPLNITEPFTVEARMKINSSGLLVRPFILGTDNGNYTWIAKLTGGKIYDHTGSNVVGTYPGNAWFNLKMEVIPDTADKKGTYSIYYNDKLLATYENPQSFTKLNTVTLAQASYSNGAWVAIDDLMIYPTPQKNDDVYSEDFSYCGLNKFDELGISGDVSLGNLDYANTYNEMNVIEDGLNRVLRLKTQQNTAAKHMSYNLKNLDLSGKIVLEQDIKVSREDTRAILFRLYDSKENLANTVWLDNTTKSFIAHNGSEPVKLKSAVKDTWVNVKVVVNVDGDKNTTDKYDVYLDGELAAEKLTLGTLSSNIIKIQFIEYMCWTPESTALIDNLRVYTVPDTSLKGTISFTDVIGYPMEGLYPEEELTITANITNSTGKDATPVLLIAMYDKLANKLLNVQSIDFETPMKTGTSDELEISLTLPEDVSGVELKAFLWNGLDNITPVTMNSLEEGIY